MRGTVSFNATSWAMVSKLYPYFVLGYLMARYQRLEHLIAHRWSVAISFVLYGSMMWLEYRGYKPLGGHLATITGLCVLLNFAKHIASQGGRASAILVYLGRNSLPIYLVHYFVLFSIAQICTHVAHPTWFAGSVVAIQLLITLLASVGVVGMSLGVIALIRSNDLLALFCLGEKPREKQGEIQPR